MKRLRRRSKSLKSLSIQEQTHLSLLVLRRDTLVCARSAVPARALPSVLFGAPGAGAGRARGQQPPHRRRHPVRPEPGGQKLSRGSTRSALLFLFSCCKMNEFHENRRRRRRRRYLLARFSASFYLPCPCRSNNQVRRQLT